MGKKGKRIPFSWFCLREREGREERVQASLYDLWSFVDRNFPCQERKFIALMMTTCGYRKRGISLRVQNEEFGKSKISGLGSVHEAS